MSKKFFLVLLLFAILPISSSYAEDKKQFSRQENIDRIIESQKLKEMWQAQVAQAREASIQQNQAIVDDLIESQNVNAKEAACIHELFDPSIVNQIDSSLVSVDTMLKVWKKHYGQSMTNGELQEFADSYTSDLAKKAILEEQNTLEKFNAEINQIRMSQSNNIANQVLQDLGKNLNNSSCLKESKEVKATPSTAPNK